MLPFIHVKVHVCDRKKRKREKEKELNVPRDVRRQEMTCSAFKAYNHW